MQHFILAKHDDKSFVKMTLLEKKQVSEKKKPLQPKIYSILTARALRLESALQ